MTNQKLMQLPLCARNGRIELSGEAKQFTLSEHLVLKHPTLISVSRLKKHLPFRKLQWGGGMSGVVLRMVKIARSQGEMVCFYEGQSKSTSLSSSHTHCHCSCYEILSPCCPFLWLNCVRINPGETLGQSNVL